MTNDDKKGWVAFLIAAIVVAGCVLALCGCSLTPESVVPTDRVPGMPLDACTVLEYDRPVWLPTCQHAYKVYDRQTGDAWWLLVMGQYSEHNETKINYIVLPLDESEDAVGTQTERTPE